jgi:hypothetical protein
MQTTMQIDRMTHICCQLWYSSLQANCLTADMTGDLVQS